MKEEIKINSELTAEIKQAARSFARRMQIKSESVKRPQTPHYRVLRSRIVPIFAPQLADNQLRIVPQSWAPFNDSYPLIVVSL